MQLPALDPYAKNNRYIEVFNRGSQAFEFTGLRIAIASSCAPLAVFLYSACACSMRSMSGLRLDRSREEYATERGKTGERTRAAEQRFAEMERRALMESF